MKKAKKSQKWVYIIIAAVVLAVLAAGAVVYFNNANNYVATVGGEKVTTAEFRFFLNQVKTKMENSAGLTDANAIKSFWASKIGGENVADKAKNDALEQAKEFKVQLTLAKKSKITLSKQEFDNVTAQVNQMVGQAPSGTDANAQFITAFGVNVSEYKAIMRNFMIVYKFMQQEEGKLTVSDDEVKKLYDTDQDVKNAVDKVTVRHILITTMEADGKTPLSQEKQDEAKKKADDLMAKVKAGEDMIALAKANSADTSVADNNGEYTFGSSDSYVPEFMDWAFKAKVGDVGVVKSQYGYHVMRLEKRTEFNDIKDDAKKAALSAKYQEELGNWKKEPKYDVAKNPSVFNSINVV